MLTLTSTEAKSILRRNSFLPTNLVISGGMTLMGKISEYLPEDIKIIGHLEINDSDINRLPKGLTVTGNVYLKNCPNLEELEESHLFGGLFVSNCHPNFHTSKAFILNKVQIK